MAMVPKGVQAAAQAKMASSKAKGTYMGFNKLANKTSPALAAWVGKKKYGNAGFNALKK